MKQYSKVKLAWGAAATKLVRRPNKEGTRIACCEVDRSNTFLPDQRLVQRQQS